MSNCHQRSRLLALLFAVKNELFLQIVIDRTHIHNKIKYFPNKNKNKLTYLASSWKVGHLIPCSNKDPVSIKAQWWEVGINVPCSLLEDTAAGILVVVDLTISSVIQICPEWSDKISGSTKWKPSRWVTIPWSIKGQVSIVVHLETHKTVLNNKELVGIDHRQPYKYQHIYNINDAKCFIFMFHYILFASPNHMSFYLYN